MRGGEGARGGGVKSVAAAAEIKVESWHGKVQLPYLKLFYEEVHIDSDIVLPTVALGGFLSKLNPAH